MKLSEIAVSVSLLGLLVSGCASLPNSALAPGSHFHGAAKADAVLSFSSWQYTFLVKPRYDDHGFLLPVRPDNIHQVFNQFPMQHGLAVVVIGWNYHHKILDGIVTRWNKLLGDCGFRRAIFLRANIYHRLNGSLVIKDSRLSPTIVQTASAQPDMTHHSAAVASVGTIADEATSGH